MLICLIVFILVPIIGLPIYILYYLLDKNKSGILYSILLGIMFGILAYYFNPPENYDLYRLKIIVSELVNLDFKSVLSLSKISDLELIPMIYSYLIALTNNFNLLQFFVVSIGYSLLCYMIIEK